MNTDGAIRTCSPFPGMDPYVEHALSGDFRASLTVFIAESLQPKLPNDLRARLHRRTFWEGSETGGCEAAEAFIKIQKAGDAGRVFTVLNVLSPENKIPGTGRDAYLQTCRESIDGGANLIEIDLIRAGQPTTVVVSKSGPPKQFATYHTSIYRRWPEVSIEYCPMPLQQALPLLPIPLRATDQEVMLDLQATVDHAYELGRYGWDTDYSKPLSPPLSPSDAEWVADQIRSPRA